VRSLKHAALVNVLDSLAQMPFARTEGERWRSLKSSMRERGRFRLTRESYEKRHRHVPGVARTFVSSSQIKWIEVHCKAVRAGPDR
jgi:hypothetical protein